MRGRSALASVEKIILKMKQQPNGITNAEANKVLNAKGYELKRTSGSHRQYVNSQGDVTTIVIRDCLKSYEVRDILNRIGE